MIIPPPHFVMVERVKYLVVEKDGTDLMDPEEHEPKGENIRISNASAIIPDGDLQSWLDRVYNSSQSIKNAYSGDDLSSSTFYSSASQVDANRLAKVDVSYSGDNPSTETWTFYDTADGTTVLATVTRTLTWLGNDLDKVETVTT